jgi:hypothetical protein
MLTMSYDDLAARTGAATVIGSAQGGSLIAPETVRRLACDANDHPHRSGWPRGDPGPRSVDPVGDAWAVGGALVEGRGVQLPWLYDSGALVRRPPPGPLGRRRHIRPQQPRPALRATPLGRPPRPPHRPRHRRERCHWGCHLERHPRQLRPAPQRDPTIRRSTTGWTTTRRSTGHLHVGTAPIRRRSLGRSVGWLPRPGRATLDGSPCPRPRPHQPRSRPLVPGRTPARSAAAGRPCPGSGHRTSRSRPLGRLPGAGRATGDGSLCPGPGPRQPRGRSLGRPVGRHPSASVGVDRAPATARRQPRGRSVVRLRRRLGLVPRRHLTRSALVRQRRTPAPGPGPPVPGRRSPVAHCPSHDAVAAVAAVAAAAVAAVAAAAVAAVAAAAVAVVSAEAPSVVELEVGVLGGLDE